MTSTRKIIDYAEPATPVTRPRRIVIVAGLLERLASAAWFSYVTIALLQLKVIWGMWKYKDLTSGDTSSYFVDAWKWYKNGTVHFAWSPLYTAFYGTFLHLSDHAYVATVLHRAVIVMLATIMVLALMRRMLPHPLAWIITAWWAVLPINFNTLYEVHLFAVLPVLAAYLVVLRRRDVWHRGLALGILCAATVLVRNELIIAVGCFTLVCFIYEIRRVRRNGPIDSSEEPPAGWAKLFVAYGAPVCVAILVVLATYERSWVKYGTNPDLKQSIESKHTLNMAQVYAFGYQQRHPDWTGNPWVGYHDLTVRDFGVAEPKLSQMVANNPKASFNHFLWNFRLTPAGLQVMLFNCTSSTLNPDYAAVKVQPRRAIVCTVVLLMILLGGLVAAIAQRRWFGPQWLRPRAWGWGLMLCVVATALLVIPTQRPRPSYLFTTTLLIMTLTGTCLWAMIAPILRRWPSLTRLLALGPIVMIAAIAVVPGYYAATATGSRPLLDAYDDLRPYEVLISHPDTRFLKGAYAGEIQFYLGRAYNPVRAYDVFDQLIDGESLATFLDRMGFNLVFLDSRQCAQLESNHPDMVTAFVNEAATRGWRLIGSKETPQDGWLLFQRRMPAATSQPSGLFTITEPDAAFAGLRFVDGMGASEGPYPQFENSRVRWGLGPRTRMVARVEPGKYMLSMRGQASLQGEQVVVRLGESVIGRIDWGPADSFHSYQLPVRIEPDAPELVLEYSNWHEAGNGLKIAVLFKELRLVPDHK